MLAEVLGIAATAEALVGGLVLWYYRSRLQSTEGQLAAVENARTEELELARGEAARLKAALDGLTARQKKEAADDQAAVDRAAGDADLAAELLRNPHGSGPVSR